MLLNFKHNIVDLDLYWSFLFKCYLNIRNKSLAWQEDSYWESFIALDLLFFSKNLLQELLCIKTYPVQVLCFKETINLPDFFLTPNNFEMNYILGFNNEVSDSLVSQLPSFLSHSVE